MKNLWKGLTTAFFALLLTCMFFVTKDDSIKINDLDSWQFIDYGWVPYLWYGAIGLTAASAILKIACLKSKSKNINVLILISSYLVFVVMLCLDFMLAWVWMKTYVSQLTNVIFTSVSIVGLCLAGIIINTSGARKPAPKKKLVKKYKNVATNRQQLNVYKVKDIDEEIQKPTYIDDAVYADLSTDQEDVNANIVNNFTSTPDDNDGNLQQKIRNMQHIVSSKPKDINWDDINVLGGQESNKGQNLNIANQPIDIPVENEFAKIDDTETQENYESLNLESVDEGQLLRDMGDNTAVNSEYLDWKVQNKKMVEEVTRLYNDINNGADEQRYINNDQNRTYEMKMPEGAIVNDSTYEEEYDSYPPSNPEIKIDIKDLYNMPYEQKDPISQTIIPRRFGTKTVRYTKKSLNNLNNLTGSHSERRRAIYNEAEAKRYKETYNISESDFIWDALKKRNRDILKKNDDIYENKFSPEIKIDNLNHSEVPEPIIDLQVDKTFTNATFNVAEKKPFGDYYSETIELKQDSATIPDPIIDSKDSNNAVSEPTIDWNL